jgi:citrate lyase subunit beta / citryl-CoA lyase
VTLRRSCLSVPATRPRFQEKADGSSADMIILDLEDSVAPSAKRAGRAGAVDALRSHPYRDKVRSVRVNPIDTPWCFDDIHQVVEGAGSLLDVVVVPKVEDVATVHFLHHLLTQLERTQGLERRIGLDLQIESATGLERVSDIARASDRLQALHFGPGDYSASIGMPGLTIGETVEDYPGDPWHYARTRILVAARANGALAVDGPYARFRDPDGLRKLSRRAAALGYDGKWAIHPDQIAILNETFAPSQAEFDRAAAILEAYERATREEATGAVELDGEMIDEATRKMAGVTVARGRAAGMKTATS